MNALNRLMPLACAVAAIALFSCGGDDPAKIAVSGVTVNKPTLTLAVGQTETLTATVAPENADDKTVTWSSGTPAVASVDAQSGLVTALAPGTATITATAGGKTASCQVTVAPAPWDGTTKTQPAGYTSTPGTVEIKTPAELAWLAAACTHQISGIADPTFTGFTFNLTSDLDLNAKEWTPIGNWLFGEAPNYFKGVFDGKGHKISNVKVERPEFGAIFGLIQNATVKNLHVASGTVNCTNAGTSYAAGICAFASTSSTIAGCSNAAAITCAGMFAGGICAQAYQATISGCENTGTVNGAKDNIGGICGYLEGGSIIACRNAATVTGNYIVVGGICGIVTDNAQVTACYNTAAVSGNTYTGGVCGYLSGGATTVTACYNTGNVTSTGDTPGGVLGRQSTNAPGVVAACYWSGSSAFGVGGASSEGSPGTGGSTYKFGASAWPSASVNAQWGTGDGSGSGKYWKSLGSWNGGSPTYPKLWWEK